MAFPPNIEMVALAPALLAEGWGELGGVILMLVIAFGGWIAGKIKETQQDKDMPKRPKHKVPRAGGGDEAPRRRTPPRAGPPRARPPSPQRRPPEPVARPRSETSSGVPDFPGPERYDRDEPPRPPHRKVPAESRRSARRPPRSRAQAEIEAKKQEALREIRRQTEAQAHAKDKAQAEILVQRAPEPVTGGVLDLPLDLDDLRRAIVLAEVLGPPVSEREAF